ncbi:MAG: acyltransferase [Microthrixaceae bacterium]|nr:acyltransferase [Microthrixaceae bacterium]
MTTATAWESKAPPMGSVKPFDGIRGIGVWLVIIHHAWAISDSISGYIDLFFVLSGFLITTLIFEEKRSTGGVSLRNFYGRRGLRLLPSLIVVLIIFWIPVPLFAPELTGQVTAETVATLFYVHNIFFSPLLGSFQYMGQMWSLSLEEQFYLIGAVATYWCIKRNWIRQMAVVLVGFILFVWVARALGHGGPGQFWFQRPDAIALGVLLAIINAELPPELPERALLWLKRAAWVALVAFVFSIFSSSLLVERITGFYVPMYPGEEEAAEQLGIDPDDPPGGDLGDAVADAIGAQVGVDPDDATKDEALQIANRAIGLVLEELPDGNYWVRWGFTLATASAAVLCLAFVRLRDDFALSRWLSARPLAYFGVLSYALYISHYQLFILMDPGFTGGPKWVPIKLLAAYLVGAGLHRWVEKPAMRYRYLFSPRSR